jgi:flavin-dependent dehydrogenase
LLGLRRPRGQIIVLGAGPVGLVAALHARRLNLPVEIWANRLPSPDDPCRIEAIPAQLVALLVELGVYPRELGVDRLFEQRVTQWRSREVVNSAAPASAHVARPALELSLLKLAARAGVRLCEGVKVGDIRSITNADATILDATGRVASTALHVVRAEAPLVARTFVQATRTADALTGFAIAAGPDGYAYRLSNVRQVALGVVGQGSLLRGNLQTVINRVRTFAPWIVEGLDPDAADAGSSGAASLQWCAGSDSHVLPIGDAYIARDALASQGLAIGIGHALRTVSALANGGPVDLAGTPLQVEQHRRRVEALIADSPFSAAPDWRRYREFLGGHLTYPPAYSPQP